MTVRALAGLAMTVRALAGLAMTDGALLVRSPRARSCGPLAATPQERLWHHHDGPAGGSALRHP